MGNQTLKATYFEYAGEVNTDSLLDVAIARACELGCRLVIASETGRSAVRALDRTKTSVVSLVVVTHYPSKTWGPAGDIPIGLQRDEYDAYRRRLEEAGVTIVQGARPFAPPSRAIQWDHPTPEGIIDKTLTVLGAGMKIAIEAVLMATDAGALAPGEEVVSCAGTFKGLDTAIVARAAHTDAFFRELDVLEIVAKPRTRVKTLPEYESLVWRGDLSPYYRADKSS